MRILVVEDDPLLGEGLVAALKRHGYTADRVSDGSAAIAACPVPRQSSNR